MFVFVFVPKQAIVDLNLRPFELCESIVRDKTACPPAPPSPVNSVPATGVKT